MTHRLTRAFALLVLAFGLSSCSHLPASGWVTLIDGSSGMENWEVAGEGNWRAEDGSIQADRKTAKSGSVLVSKRTFKDFELYVELWASEDTNSGIYFRAPNPKQMSTSSGAYEVQIWDNNPNPAYSTGSLVNLASVKPIYKADGRWNTFEVYANGSHISVKMNGEVTVVASDSRSPKGHLGLQMNNGAIKVRKLLIREL